LGCTVFASLTEVAEQWAAFKSKHGKLYQNQQEEKMRFSVFQQNLRAIEEHNRQFEAGTTTYTKGINQFTDRTKEEITAYFKRQSARRPKLIADSIYEKPVGLKVPDSIDWRQSGAVSKVKDQMNCGSCYAFAATGVLESYYYLKTNQMLLFSEQQIVDCDPTGNCDDGGDEGDSLYYVMDYGIETEDSYPYTARDGKCRYNQDATISDLSISQVVLLEEKNEEDLFNAIGSVGPLSVAIDADEIASYSGGVFSSDSCSKTELNHAVLAVGYGTENGVDYWIVKNSWSEDWGDNGYFKMRRGTDECGISTECHYVVLN
jgi:cathepsin L